MLFIETKVPWIKSPLHWHPGIEWTGGSVCEARGCSLCHIRAHRRGVSVCRDPPKDRERRDHRHGTGRLAALRVGPLDEVCPEPNAPRPSSKSTAETGTRVLRQSPTYLLIVRRLRGEWRFATAADTFRRVCLLGPSRTRHGTNPPWRSVPARSGSLSPRHLGRTGIVPRVVSSERRVLRSPLRLAPPRVCVASKPIGIKAYTRNQRSGRRSVKRLRKLSWRARGSGGTCTAEVDHSIRGYRVSSKYRSSPLAVAGREESTPTVSWISFDGDTYWVRLSVAQGWPRTIRVTQSDVDGATE